MNIALHGASVSPGVAVEISPLWALDAEGVAERVAKKPLAIEKVRYLRD